MRDKLPLDDRIANALRLGPLTVRQIATRLGYTTVHVNATLLAYPDRFGKVAVDGQGSRYNKQWKLIVVCCNVCGIELEPWERQELRCAACVQGANNGV
jgi:hypothetical protein